MSGVSESPFDKTLFADGASRMRLLRAIGSASRARSYTFQGHRMSAGESAAMQGAALREADQGLFNAARLALLRERQACAAIAGKFSPDAAGEILSRPEPDAWRAP
jgi:hypothetical protein